MKPVLHLIFAFALPLSAIGEGTILEKLRVDAAWVANQVSFDLHTAGDKQFVAYYDADRVMTVASRTLGSDQWKRKALPSKLVWDSHNYVTMGIDETGYLHVAGNMHVNPLVYFRSTRPYDVSSLEPVHRMIGVEENDVTYPKFFQNKDDSLLFSYRSGTCGNGNVLVNRFDTETGQWERYLQEALFEGIDESDVRAAYHHFVRDEAGNFHVAWIWRWTPMVETSHQICYAVSPDFINWKNAAGEPVSLPFRPDDSRVIVDPVPSQGGSHNGRYQVFLTQEEHPVIGYIKYDEDGLTQLYLARPEGGEWLSRQISNWNFRWNFVEGGDRMTIGGRFQIAGLSNEGNLLVNWETERRDSGRYVVDPVTLEVVNQHEEYPRPYPEELYRPISNHPGLSVVHFEGKGAGPNEDVRYVLKWEAGPREHGRRAPEIMPDGPISPLFVYSIQEPQ